MKKMTKTAIAILIGILIGLAAAWVYEVMNNPWRQFHERYEYMENPRNYEKHEPSGLYAVDHKDLSVPLAKLVRDGEVAHLDLVMPEIENIPEANKIWMKAVNEDPELLWAEGKSLSTNIDIPGRQVLHLNIWYVPGAINKVQNIIDKIHENEHEK